MGSSLQDESDARDIDLAVEGLAPDLFFKFYTRLFRHVNVHGYGHLLDEKRLRQFASGASDLRRAFLATIA